MPSNKINYISPCRNGKFDSILFLCFDAIIESVNDISPFDCSSELSCFVNYRSRIGDIFSTRSTACMFSLENACYIKYAWIIVITM